MIRIFQLDDDDTLTTGQKIQGVIDIAADVVKNNLYHIEGNAIAQGKIKHLRNFLELLEALSDNAIIHKGEIDVRSAPDVGKS